MVNTTAVPTIIVGITVAGFNNNGTSRGTSRHTEATTTPACANSLMSEGKDMAVVPAGQSLGFTTPLITAEICPAGGVDGRHTKKFA